MIHYVGYKKCLKLFAWSILIALLLIFYRHMGNEGREKLLNLFREMEDNTYAGVLFIVITIIVSALFVPISWMKAIGGICFGLQKGFVYCLIAGTLSCSISFFIARFLGRESILRIYLKISKDKKGFHMMNDIVNQPNFSTVFLLRNLHFVPFALINTFFGVTKISYKEYIVASIIGMVPGTLIVTYFFAKAVDLHHLSVQQLFPLSWVVVYYVIIYLYRGKLIEKTKDKDVEI